jgi:hypothetical protein
MSCRRLVLALALLAACARGSSTPTDGAVADTSVQPRDATVDSNGCAVQPCSILPQCGCNGATACDYDDSDDTGTACRAILMTGTETSDCNEQTDCDRGFVCVGGAAFASCKKYCSADADCGAPRGQCVYTLTANSAPIPDVPQICSSNCDPTDINAAECPSAFKCTLYTINDSGTTKKIADCSPAGTGMQGTDCSNATNTGPFESRCAPGFQCVKLTTDTNYKCRRICTPPTAVGVNSPSCGGGTQRCLTYSPPHVIGGTDYGICLP